MELSTLELSKQSLRYAVEMCEAHPNYQAMVIVKTQPDVEWAYEIITDYLDMTQYVIGSDHKIIRWKNGSHIKLVLADNTARHERVRLVLLAASLDEKERKRINRCARQN